MSLPFFDECGTDKIASVRSRLCLGPSNEMLGPAKCLCDGLAAIFLDDRGGMVEHENRFSCVLDKEPLFFCWDGIVFVNCDGECNERFDGHCVITLVLSQDTVLCDC